MGLVENKGFILPNSGIGNVACEIKHVMCYFLDNWAQKVKVFIYAMSLLAVVVLEHEINKGFILPNSELEMGNSARYVLFSGWPNTIWLVYFFMLCIY